MKAPTIKKYLKAHRILGRWTTFNGAMQGALAVPEPYDRDKVADALLLLGQDIDAELTCVYCGVPAATWDHLENNVQRGHFSGFGNRIWNLVPACRTCNESKGGKSWRAFIERLGVADRAERADRLAAFAKRNVAERFGWEQMLIEFPELAQRYELLVAEIRSKIQEADVLAAEIRARTVTRLGEQQPARASDTAPKVP